MAQIKNFIENNFSLLLLVGAVSGFFIPSIGSVADEVVIFLTAFLIFLSCADIRVPDFLKVDIFQIALFTVLRYALFPLALFYLAYGFFPEYAIGILLLSLMPAGVSVASLCSMSGAKVALGLSLTIISSLLAPAFVPSVFSFLGQIVNVDIKSLFFTLIVIVFAPICLYYGLFSKIEKTKVLIKEYNKSSSVFILSIILAIVIAAQKHELLNNPGDIFTGMIIMIVLFTVCYLFGIIYSLFVPKDEKVPYIFASGAMNNSLAVGLAFAYFDAKIAVFMVLSEIVWSFYVAFGQWYFLRKTKKSKPS